MRFSNTSTFDRNGVEISVRDIHPTYKPNMACKMKPERLYTRSRLFGLVEEHCWVVDRQTGYSKVGGDSYVRCQILETAYTTRWGHFLFRDFHREGDLDRNYTHLLNVILPPGWDPHNNPTTRRKAQ